MSSILDTNRNTWGHYDRLKAAGVKTVIRYIAFGLEKEEKVIKHGEAQGIADAGLRLGLVYEIGGRPNGFAIGQRDGAYSRQYAPKVGAPTDGSVIIWYTVDFDASPAQYPGIREAFRGFKEALGPEFRVGAYASGFICDKLFNEGLIVARWLTDSMGFAGTRDSIANGRYEMRQFLPATIAGLDTDPDAAHILADGSVADIGDFVPFRTQPKENEDGLNQTS